jgi:hypothetical protein
MITCTYMMLLLYMMKVFGAVNYFRLILTTPLDKTREACERIVQFCLEHEKVVDVWGLRTIRISRTVGDEGLTKHEESILPFHTKPDKYKSECL